jgi:hypothetical protein
MPRSGRVVLDTPGTAAILAVGTCVKPPRTGRNVDQTSPSPEDSCPDHLGSDELCTHVRGSAVKQSVRMIDIWRRNVIDPVVEHLL